MRILLAIDGSPYSDAAVEEVAQRPWASGSEILVITAFEVPWSATPDVWALPPEYYAECERVVQMHARAQSIQVSEASPNLALQRPHHSQPPVGESTQKA